jgi:hypothetical protein
MSDLFEEIIIIGVGFGVLIGNRNEGKNTTIIS